VFGLFSSDAMRSSFFTHPRRVALSTGAASAFALLIPTCLKLAPLGQQQRHDRARRNDASDAYNAARSELDSADANLAEAYERIIDLDCAMANYSSFNERMFAFQERLDQAATLPPLDRLSLIWDVNFADDIVTHEQYIQEKSWDESVYKYGNYYGRHGYAWGPHWVTETHRYYETTKIENQYKNIAIGRGIIVAPLACGYYSREFRTMMPETYITYQSPSVRSGHRESGNTYIDLTKQYGSLIPTRFHLDENQTTPIEIVPREVNNTAAANEVAAKLYQFLAASIALFNITGGNYLAVQQGIRRSIPVLTDSVHQANETMQEKALILFNQQTFFNAADRKFKEELSLWLPLLFLVPVTLACFVYLLVPRCCKPRATSQSSAQVPTDTRVEEIPEDGHPLPAPEETYEEAYRV
jgi:hypothetical protein